MDSFADAPRILVVDDDIVVLDLLRNTLRREIGYDLTCCESAEEALELIDEADHAFDCMLLDIMLPGSDGITLCEDLRATRKYRDTPILMITGSKQVDLMEKAYRAGATDFISKPFNGLELGARINSATMLNASLNRERIAREQLDELLRQQPYGVDAAAHFQVDGLVHPAEIENTLLRLPTGCHFLRLFAVELDVAENFWATGAMDLPAESLQNMVNCCIESLGSAPVRMAHAGGGRFIGVLFSRRATNFELRCDEVNTLLATKWQDNPGGRHAPLKVRMYPLNGQRLWSGFSAAEKFRNHVARAQSDDTTLTDETKTVEADEFAGDTGSDMGDNLFSRMEYLRYKPTSEADDNPSNSSTIPAESEDC